MLSSGVFSKVFLALLCANGALSLPFDDGKWHPSGAADASALAPTGSGAAGAHGGKHPGGGATSTLAPIGTSATGVPGLISTTSSVDGSMDDPTSTDLSDPSMPTGAPSAGVPPTGGNSTSSAGSSSGPGKAPYFVVYNDRGPDPAPDVSKVQGFNVVALSFMLSTGPADMALAWKNLPESQRNSIKQKYKQAGIKLIVSAFGSTEQPTSKNMDPKKTASDMVQYVKQYGLDGIDVDYEDIDAMNKGDGKAEQWLEDFTTALRAELPKGQYILSHAPMAPWMGDTSSRWKSGAYVTVNKKVGDQIDFYNVQFYNQGANEYTTCDGLLTKSTSANPKSSLFEIAGQGFDLNKLVIGKPAAQTDASNGQMSASTLATCLQQAKQKKWNGGAMSWQYPNADSRWISTVRGSAFGGSSSGSSGSTGDDTTSPSSAAPSLASGSAGTLPTGTAVTSDPAGALPTGSAGADPTDDMDSTSDAVIGTATGTAALGGAASPSSIIQGGVQGSSWSSAFTATVGSGPAATNTPATGANAKVAPVRRYSRLNNRRRLD